MSPVRDFLQRFRPAGAPGKSAAAAIPADRARDLAAELEPVLSMLADAEMERERMVRTAQDDARRIRDGAKRQADDLVAEARQRAEAVRARTAAAVLARAEADAAAALRDAERDAAAIGVRAAKRMPSYVSSCVQAILTLAGQDARTGEEAAAGGVGQEP